MLIESNGPSPRRAPGDAEAATVPGAAHAAGAGRRLLSEALKLLTGHWSHTVQLGDLLAAHHERVVFTTRARDGQRAVVKADTAPARLCKERDGIHTAATAGVPTPPVLDHVETGGLALLVTAHVDAAPLSEARGEAGWRDAGRCLRELHESAAPPEGLQAFSGASDWWAHFRWWAGHEGMACADRGLLPQDTLTRIHASLLEAFSEQPAPPVRMLHGDCRPEHWLIRDGAVAAVIDFGDVCLGDPVWELSVMTAQHPESLPALIDGYRASPAVRARLAQLWTPYRLMRQLAAAAWMHDHGLDPTAVVENLDRLAGAH